MNTFKKAILIFDIILCYMYFSFSVLIFPSEVRGEPDMYLAPALPVHMEHAFMC
jgi:hypothetical protein